jgi:hypothetical protein
MTKTDAIRDALKAGVTKPTEIVAYVKKTHNMDVAPGLVSTTKSLENKRAEKATEAPRTEAPRKVGRPAGSGQSAKLEKPAPKTGSVADDLTALSELVKKYGVGEVTKLAQLVG